MKKLSIITINYNNEKGLKSTIRSIVEQTRKDFEYIIIDGNSTDGSVNVIKEYSQHITFWVSEPDKGIYNAMNKGVEKASGEYCLFLNSGDRLIDNTIYERVEPKLNSFDIITGKVKYDNGRIFNCPNNPTLDFFNNSSLHHQGSFIRTSLLKKHPYREDYKISADMYFFVNTIIFNDATYKKIDDIISLYDTTGISSTDSEFGKNEAKNIFKQLMSHRIYEDFCLFHGKSDEYYKLFYDIAHTKHKWTFYNIIVRLLKIFMFNKEWVKELHVHK